MSPLLQHPSCRVKTIGKILGMSHLRSSQTKQKLVVTNHLKTNNLQHNKPHTREPLRIFGLHMDAGLIQEQQCKLTPSACENLHKDHNCYLPQSKWFETHSSLHHTSSQDKVRQMRKRCTGVESHGFGGEAHLSAGLRGECYEKDECR